MGQEDVTQKYLHEVRNRGFVPHVWDCITFANTGWKRSHDGVGFADSLCSDYVDHLGLYKRPAQLIEDFGCSCVEDWLDTVLTRHVGIPVIGSLVVSVETDISIVGFSFGLCAGSHCGFLGRKRVVYRTTSNFNEYWT